jgi:hypothetical protein
MVCCVSALVPIYFKIHYGSRIVFDDVTQYFDIPLRECNVDGPNFRNQLKETRL